MADIKVIALDIDGTLTDHSRKICLNAIEAIRNVEKIGIPVVIVTGNIFYFSYAAATLIGATGGIVAENGGVISKLDENGFNSIEVLSNRENIDYAYEYLVDNFSDKYDIRKVDDSPARLSEIAMYRTFDGDTLKNLLKDFDVEVYDTHFALHITDSKVNKGTGLKSVVENLGFKLNNVLAVGDSENDIEFLNAVGIKVAVNNADDKLKKIADYVTVLSYGDGVAEAIDKFVFNDYN
ncbi:MAG: phosphoglycolate phosphatase [Methanobrevibacter sp.]|jgi:phosphoglycolate phosphatase (TIGR01487 family)|nr:phosphoglycolate phosphatase [Candidatus Methanoflexus mossambicus]